MKSILTFKKWTKKMSKNRMPKKSLLTKFSLTIIKIYRHKLNQIFFFMIVIFFIKKLKVFFISYIMEIKEIKKLEKNLKKYFCEICDFKCCQKCDWDKHISRPKHIRNSLETKKLEKTFFCEYCDKDFKTNSGLWKHIKMCKLKEIIIKKEELIHDKKDELIAILLKQNSELIKEHSDIKELILEVIKNGTNNTINNTTNTNSHNKAFNLNFFLNETCKNAMNITDFVDSIKLQLSDLMVLGELGYIEGISKIIVKNLNNLDETIRPIHCTDKKRETMYVKDEGQWEKEDDNKTKLKKAVKRVANKNIKLLPQFRETYPEYNNSSARISDTHDKIVIEVMTSDVDKDDKIIKNISNVTTISKL